MQCLWVIFRKTYGWHKKEDSISLSQFSEMTGISRRNVCRAISRLVSKKTLSVVKKDTGITTYQFNKDFDSWLPVSKKTLVSKKTRPSVNIDHKVVSKKTHTKEIKETIQKKVLPDDEWIEKIKKINPWINWEDLNREMDTWLLNNPKRQKTRGFITNWILNKQKDKPMPTNKPEFKPPPSSEGPDWIKDAIKDGWKV